MTFCASSSIQENLKPMFLSSENNSTGRSISVAKVPISDEISSAQFRYTRAADSEPDVVTVMGEPGVALNRESL